MKNWLLSLRRPKGINEYQSNRLPWLEGVSIYDHISRNISPVTGKVKEEGKQLPDEERRFSNSGLRYAPGAMDGVFVYHTSYEVAPERVKNVSRYILDISIKNSEGSKISLYQILVQDELSSYIDEALREIVSKLQATKHLREFALLLAKVAPDRGPVKFAIALLGILHNPADVDIVSLLGRHDEFTLYSVVALTSMLEDPEREIWMLAQRVDGWGKIHCVERLASTNNPEIKGWLLRKGYQNEVMNEYLAYDCAVGGDLRAALSASDVDEELLRAAGEIIEALLTGGPGQDIKDYRDSADVILRYLELLEERETEVDHYLVVNSILKFLTQEWDLEANIKNGWDAENREQAIILANRILGKPTWRETIEKALNSENEYKFYRASAVADQIGIDTWGIHWDRLKEKPLDGGRWFNVMKEVDKRRIDQVVDLAIKVLPLEEVATGPADELGLGPNFQVHECLDFIVQDLKSFPGKGWLLIAASLKSPITRNRNMAFNALEGWGMDQWPEGATQVLLEAASIEPNKELKERMEKMIRDWNIYG